MVTLRSVTLCILLAVLISWAISGCSRGTNRAGNRTDTGSVSSQSKEDTDVPTGQLPQADRPVVPGITGGSEDQPAEQLKPESGRILPSDHPLHEKWPRSILTAVLSPHGKTVAIHDDAGVFLADQKGGSARRVKVTLLENLANEQVAVFFAFRPDSRRLAILTRLSYGEPMGAFIERLWTADVATGCSRRLSEWSDRFQGPGPIVGEHRIEGWTQDGKSVIVTGVVYVGEMPGEMRQAGTKQIVIKDIPCK